MADRQKNADQSSVDTMITRPAGYRSMKYKLMFLMVLCGLFSGGTIGAFALFQIKDITQRKAIDQLAAESRLVGVQFAQSYQRVADDLKTVAITSPIRGYMRAIENDGIDPKDGSTLEEWKDRLSVVFSALLSNRPEYFQFRLIEATGSGLELVRVDRTPYGLRRVPKDELQDKSGEAYFKFGLDIRPYSVAFSDVTPNREHGVVEEQARPALRAIFPIDDALGTRRALLIINVNYEKLLKRAFASATPQYNTIAVNGRGDFMEYLVNGASYGNRLVLAADGKYKPTQFVTSFLNSDKKESLIEGGDQIGYFVRLNSGFEQVSAEIGLIQYVSRSEFFADANAFTQRVLEVGALLFFPIALLSIYAARKFITPLLSLVKKVRRLSKEQLVEELPDEGTDEVGDLAAAIKHRTRRLLETEMESSAIINRITDGILLIDEMGTLEKYSPGNEAIFGYSPEEVLGKNISMLMPDQEAELHDAHLERADKEGFKHQLVAFRELEAKNKEGDLIPIELCVNSMDVGGQRKYIGVVRDVSHRQEIDRMRNEFISTVSHELRTPLTSIRGSLALANTLAASTEVPEKVSKMMDLALKNSERLNLLVNDILDLEKLRSGKTTFDLSEVDLNEAVEESVALNQHYALERNVKLKATPLDQPVVVKVDKARLQQVLSNLVSNAAKFSHENGTVDVQIGLEGETAKLYVIDAGMGIPDDFKAYIFDPFSQADGSERRKKGGTGLGLNITKRLVEGMDGGINFTSEEGVGTTFVIEFPRLQNAELVRPPRLADEGTLIGLYIDHEEEMAEALCYGLEGEVECLHEVTLSGARKRLSEQAFDFVIVNTALYGDEESSVDLLDEIPDAANVAVIALSEAGSELEHPSVDMVLDNNLSSEGELVSVLASILLEMKNGVLSRAVADPQLQSQAS